MRGLLIFVFILFKLTVVGFKSASPTALQNTRHSRSHLLARVPGLCHPIFHSHSCIFFNSSFRLFFFFFRRKRGNIYTYALCQSVIHFPLDQHTTSSCSLKGGMQNTEGHIRPCSTVVFQQKTTINFWVKQWTATWHLVINTEGLHCARSDILTQQSKPTSMPTLPQEHTSQNTFRINRRRYTLVVILCSSPELESLSISLSLSLHS